MQPRIEAVVDELINARLRLRQNQLWVGIAGLPGSGKSTISSAIRIALCNRLDDPQAGVVIGMDGWHLSKLQLSALPNPTEALKRRGAPWTFDPEGMLACLTEIKLRGQGVCPSFDHKIGDPCPNAICVCMANKFVLVCRGGCVESQQGVFLYTGRRELYFHATGSMVQHSRSF